VRAAKQPGRSSADDQRVVQRAFEETLALFQAREDLLFASEPEVVVEIEELCLVDQEVAVLDALEAHGDAVVELGEGVEVDLAEELAVAAVGDERVASRIDEEHLLFVPVPGRRDGPGRGRGQVHPRAGHGRRRRDTYGAATPAKDEDGEGEQQGRETVGGRRAHRDPPSIARGGSRRAGGRFRP